MHRYIPLDLHGALGDERRRDGRRAAAPARRKPRPRRLPVPGQGPNTHSTNLKAFFDDADEQGARGLYKIYTHPRPGFTYAPSSYSTTLK